MTARSCGYAERPLRASQQKMPLQNVQLKVPSEVLRVVVVGAGSIGREFALRHFGPHTRTAVAAVVDCDGDAAARLAVDVGSVAAGAAVKGGGYRETVSDTRGTPVPHASSLTDAILSLCDAVYIGTTPASHLKLVRAALSSGKHVLLEKPLAATPADADAIVEAASAAAARGVHTHMNIGMRFNAALHEMRRIGVETAGLGPLRSCTLGLHFARWPREWQTAAWCAGRAEGGPLREVGTHFLFALHELFGHGCVRRVRARLAYDGTTEDAAETAADGLLELSNGLTVELRVTTDGSVSGAAEDLYDLVITGADSALALESFTALRRLGRRKKTIVREGPYGRAECVHAFVAAAEAQEASPWKPVTPVEGRNAQRVLDALLGSSGEWVDVSYTCELT